MAPIASGRSGNTPECGDSLGPLREGQHCPVELMLLIAAFGLLEGMGFFHWPVVRHTASQPIARNSMKKW